MSKRALIVDDEPDIRELLEITLGRMDIETKAARDVKSATELLESHAFDLCLTDMRLPDGDGIELVRRDSTPPSAAARGRDHRPRQHGHRDRRR